MEGSLQQALAARDLAEASARETADQMSHMVSPARFEAVAREAEELRRRGDVCVFYLIVFYLSALFIVFYL
jgi:hypothetical protein